MNEGNSHMWCGLGHACALLLLVVGVGCSNDVELPTAYHQDRLDQPDQVQSSVSDNVLTVTWRLGSTVNATGLVVSFTDSTARQQTRFVDDATATSHEESSLDLTAGTFYLIQVWAVDDRGFYGPSSAVDTLIVGG